MHYQWSWTNEKNNQLILWELSSIDMKIVNEIVCNLNWIKVQFISIQIRKLNLNKIEIKFLNLIQWSDFKTTEWNSIERKCDAKGIRKLLVTLILKKYFLKRFKLTYVWRAMDKITWNIWYMVGIKYWSVSNIPCASPYNMSNSFKI